jgi:predicted phosphoribosyltransferase
MFLNREEAGKLLAEKLVDYNNDKNTVIVAIPRGGVPVGYVIAKELNLPLEVVLSKKIMHPFHKEYAIGAVTLKNRILSDVAAEVSKVYIDNETGQVRDLLRQRHTWYYGHKDPLELKNRTVIIVDDGCCHWKHINFEYSFYST